MKTRLILLAAALAAGMHAAVSLGNPVGLIEDDSVQILLARSLRHGAFALPDANGVPISDPLPGLALLLMAPAWLVEPNWHPLRAVSLLSLAVAVFFAWRLGRRLLPEPWPAIAAGLTALSPVLVRHAGLVLPDIPYLALTLIALDLGTSRGTPGVVLAGLAASLAALVRPHGAFLCLALAAGLPCSSPAAPEAPIARSGTAGRLFLKGKRARGLIFLASLVPLILWLARNKLVAGVSTGYAVNWRMQAALLGDLGAQLSHAIGLLSSFFGGGMAGITRPAWLGLAAGALVAASAAFGAARLMQSRREEQPLVFSMAAYAIMLLALHLTWSPEDSRYAIPLTPLAWLFVCGAVQRSASNGRSPMLGQGLLMLLALSALWMDARLVRAGLHRNRSYQPETMEWLRRNTPPGARIESLKYNTVMLLTGRMALPPPLHLSGPAEWAAASRAAGVALLHVEDSFRPGGFVPPGAADIGAAIGAWARAAPGVRLAYRNASEGASVFELKEP
ncbi:MAG: glycosyltransferase family 39 protein [Elusimicrobia bacterium]|nr:glycosyltransferase family 39 protein [Elusimicrobiota bacterium]